MGRKQPKRPSAPMPVDPAALPVPELSRQHNKTLRAVLERPTRADIPWRSIVALFKALGAEVSPGRGSRVRVALRGERATFHEPHPQRVTIKGAVESVRGFLDRAGVRS